MVLGVFIFVLPRLFTFQHGSARDAWAASALIMSLSVAAIFAFADWEEWLELWLVDYAPDMLCHEQTGEHPNGA